MRAVGEVRHRHQGDVMSDKISEIFDGELAANTTTATTDEANQEVETPEFVEADVKADENVGQAEEPSQAEPSGEQVDVTEERAEKGNPVPLSTFLDMRDRAKEAENREKQHQAELDRLRQQLETAQSPADQRTYNFDDPQGVADYVAEQLFQERVRMSHAHALRSHDAETVANAVAWATQRANADAKFDRDVTLQADPVEWAIQQHKAATNYEDFTTDPDAWALRRAAELGYVKQPTIVAPAPVVTATKTEKTLPRSMADLPGAGTTSSRALVKKDHVVETAFNPDLRGR